MSLTRRAHLKSRRQRRPSLSEFHAAVVTEPCVLGPMDCEGRLEAHHVIAAQKLRRIGREDMVADPRNGMSLCERHHRRHTLGFERIPFSALREETIAFADELSLVWYLERFYPVMCPDCGERIINRGAHFERCTG